MILAANDLILSFCTPEILWWVLGGIGAFNDAVIAFCTERNLWRVTGTVGLLALLASGARP